MRFRTNKIFEKNKQGKQGIGLGLVYPSAEAIEIKRLKTPPTATNIILATRYLGAARRTVAPGLFI